MEWTDESITCLRDLWQDGHSTAEIGRRMQITKNAVVGKAHRLTLPPRPSPIRKNLELAGTGLQTQRSTLAGASLPQRARPSAVAIAPSAAEQPAFPDSQAPSVAVPATPGEADNVRTLHPLASILSDTAGTIDKPVQKASAARPAPVADSELDEPTHPALRAVPATPRRRGLTCCWPLGDPGTKQFSFCGGDPVAGKPYCAQHAALAYVKLRDRRDSVA